MMSQSWTGAILRRSKPFAGAVALAALAMPAGGAAAEPPAKTWDIRLGAGVAYQPDYEGSDDYDIEPLPFATVSYRDLVFLRGPMLGANLLTYYGPGEVGKFQAGPLIRYRFGRDEDDNDALRGLGDVDGSIEVGGFVSFDSGPWSAGVTLFQDVSGGHEGLTAELEAGYGVPLGDSLRLAAGLSATWASDDYMQSFFGVSAVQAQRSGLRRHEAEAGFKNVGLALSLDYAVTESWSVTARVGYERLLGDAADSPIVEDEGSANQLGTALFVSYRF